MMECNVLGQTSPKTNIIMNMPIEIAHSYPLLEGQSTHPTTRSTTVLGDLSSPQTPLVEKHINLTMINMHK